MQWMASGLRRFVSLPKRASSGMPYTDLRHLEGRKRMVHPHGAQAMRQLRARAGLQYARYHVLRQLHSERDLDRYRAAGAARV
jgi:hypothetical protein